MCCARTRVIPGMAVSAWQRGLFGPPSIWPSAGVGPVQNPRPQTPWPAGRGPRPACSSKIRQRQLAWVAVAARSAEYGLDYLLWVLLDRGLVKCPLYEVDEQSLSIPQHLLAGGDDHDRTLNTEKLFSSLPGSRS